jgi:hypothetical protein
MNNAQAAIGSLPFEGIPAPTRPPLVCFSNAVLDLSSNSTPGLPHHV